MIRTTVRDIRRQKNESIICTHHWLRSAVIVFDHIPFHKTCKYTWRVV